MFYGEQVSQSQRTAPLSSFVYRHSRLNLHPFNLNLSWVSSRSFITIHTGSFFFAGKELKLSVCLGSV
jgi:hypothetical protein